MKIGQFRLWRWTIFRRVARSTDIEGFDSATDMTRPKMKTKLIKEWRIEIENNLEDIDEDIGILPEENEDRIEGK